MGWQTIFRIFPLGFIFVGGNMSTKKYPTIDVEWVFRDKPWMDEGHCLKFWEDLSTKKLQQLILTGWSGINLGWM